MYVFGPETHMTSICSMALGKRPIPRENNVEFATANFLLPSGQGNTDSNSTSGETLTGGLSSAMKAWIRRPAVSLR